MRFIYCACCISYILNDWSGVDIPRIVQYIKKSRVINSFLVNYAFQGRYEEFPCCFDHSSIPDLVYFSPNIMLIVRIP